jgi:hypothetical protein
LFDLIASECSLKVLRLLRDVKGGRVAALTLGAILGATE